MEILNFTEEHNSFRERLKVFLAEEVTPFGDQWEEDKIVPSSVWQKMGQGGFLCTDVAAEYGGMGGDFLYSRVRPERYSISAGCISAPPPVSLLGFRHASCPGSF